MDEKYTNSFIKSAQNYLYNLEYLGNNDNITLRALGTLRILNQLYNWADWFGVCEKQKIKLEQLINCIILRNSNLVLAEIIPGPYYSNVSTPQTIYTWQKVYDMSGAETHEEIDTDLPDSYWLSVSTNLQDPVQIIVNKADLSGASNGNTPFSREYWSGEQVRLTAPNILPGNITFAQWIIDGVNQPLGNNVVDITMNSNKTVYANYIEPTPTLGSITISKVLLNESDEVIHEPALFEISISGQESRTGFVRENTPLTFVNLPFGTYTITEVPVDGYSLRSITPSTITLAAGSPDMSIVITNIKLSSETLGVVTVYKTILSRESEESEDNTVFSIELRNGEHSFIGEISQNTSYTFYDVPLGVYELIEEQVDGYITPIPTMQINISELNPIVVKTFVNVKPAAMGNIYITKEILDSNNNPDTDDRTGFLVTITSGEESFTQVVTQLEGILFENIPFGTYTISELADPNYEPINTQAWKVTITEENPYGEKTITNRRLFEEPAAASEQSFEFCLTTGLAEVFDIDLYATNNYTIDRAILESDGLVSGCAIKINGVSVAGLDNMNISALQTFTATGLNTVNIGDRITLTSTTDTSGTPTVIKGKITFI